MVLSRNLNQIGNGLETILMWSRNLNDNGMSRNLSDLVRSRNLNYIDRIHVSAEVSNFTSEVLLLSPSLAISNDRSSIATIKNCQIGITTWFIDSLACCSLNK